MSNKNIPVIGVDELQNMLGGKNVLPIVEDEVEEESQVPAPPKLSPEAIKAALEKPVAAEEKADEPAPANIGRCQNCGWDLRRTPVEISAEDKSAYLQTLPTGALFRKRYSLFGGQVVLEFRELTTEETNLVYEAVNRRIRPGTDPITLGATINNYRFMLQLSKYIANNTIVLASDGLSRKYNPDGTSFYDVSSEKDEHILEALERQLRNGVLKRETVAMAIMREHAKFSELLNALREKANDENFYRAT